MLASSLATFQGLESTLANSHGLGLALGHELFLHSLERAGTSTPVPASADCHTSTRGHDPA